MKALTALSIALALSGCYSQRYEYVPEKKAYHFKKSDLWVDEAFPEPGRQRGPALPGQAYEDLFEDELRSECPQPRLGSP